MATPNKTALETSYRATMNDMQEELTPGERAWSRIIHSPVGSCIGKLFASVLLRPRSLITGAALALITLFATYLSAFIYHTPFNATESLVAFGFGWCIGLLYDLFFVISRSRTR